MNLSSKNKIKSLNPTQNYTRFFLLSESRIFTDDTHGADFLGGFWWDPVSLPSNGWEPWLGEDPTGFGEHRIIPIFYSTS